MNFTRFRAHLDTATGARGVPARSCNEAAKNAGIFARPRPGRKCCGPGHPARFASGGRLAVAVSRCTARFTLGVVTLSAVLLSAPVFADNIPRTSDYDYDTPAPGTYTLPAIKPAADGDVL